MLSADITQMIVMWVLPVDTELQCPPDSNNPEDLCMCLCTLFLWLIYGMKVH